MTNQIQVSTNAYFWKKYEIKTNITLPLGKHASHVLEQFNNIYLDLSGIRVLHSCFLQSSTKSLHGSGGIYVVLNTPSLAMPES